MKTFTILILLLSANFSYSQCLPNGIFFTTQGQIDSFSINYPGCTEIGVQLKIAGDDISNLNGLLPVTTINGGIFIYGNPNLINLSGLQNLITVNGFIWISSNQTLENINGIAHINAYHLTQVTIYGNPNLNQCNIFSVCNYLSIAEADISGNGNGCNSNEEVKDACCIADDLNDCVYIGLNIGDPCNDYDPATINDIITGDCLCAGTDDGTTNDNEPSTEEAGLLLFPNPVNDLLIVGTDKEISHIKIFNQLGKLVKQTSSKTVDVSQLPSGIYFAEIEQEGKRIMEPFIKQQ